MQSVRPLQAPAAAPLKSCREIEEEEQEEGEAEAENQRNERMYRLDLSPVLNTRLVFLEAPPAHVWVDSSLPFLPYAPRHANLR